MQLFTEIGLVLITISAFTHRLFSTFYQRISSVSIRISKSRVILTLTFFVIAHPSLPVYAARIGVRTGILFFSISISCNVVDLLDCLGGILCGEGGTHHVADIGIHRLEDLS